MNIRLKAKSSSSDFYDVDFIYENKTLQVYCTCKAGSMRMPCKHRLALLKGDKSMLSDQSQINQLDTVVQWANQVGFTDLIQQLNNAEDLSRRAQREVKKIKKKLEEGMNNGLHG